MSTEFHPLDTDSQEAAHEAQRLKEKQDRDSEESDLKWLMSSKRGRRIVWRLLERAGVFRTSFSTNAMQMAFVEGNKNEGYRTLGLIHSHCRELYPRMVEENANDD
ncbi:MAG: endopeptidase [Pseudomonadota bacterium]|jgi:hypothetical protein